MASQHNALIRTAATNCGALVEPGPSFVETKLVRAFCASVLSTQPTAFAAPTFVPIPDWNPQPGGTDIVVSAPGVFDGRLLLEVKVDAIEQMLWDLFKVVSGSQIDDVGAVYLLGAARAVKSRGLAEARWAGSQACGELFDPENSGRIWEARGMLETWAKAWVSLLAGGSARPKRVPARVRVTFIGSSHVPAFPGHEVRCVEVHVEGDEWLEMRDGRLIRAPSSDDPAFEADEWL